MDAASTIAAPSISPEQREPTVNWSLLHKLAGGKVIKTGVEAPDERQLDRKPAGDDMRKCQACGVKYPGGMICGYCRGRVAELRAAASSAGGRP